MSTEVTPESLRTHALWLDAHNSPIEAAALRCEAARLERERKPLPTEPGWYSNIVVERGGESCTGALLTPDRLWWCTPAFLDGNFLHRNSGETTIRWAEQDGTTPGQTLYEAEGGGNWSNYGKHGQAEYERVAAAVLAAHGTPTLTPVGKHPEPGTRGLLSVVLVGEVWCCNNPLSAICGSKGEQARTILADPRPDGAHE